MSKYPLSETGMLLPPSKRSSPFPAFLSPLQLGFIGLFALPSHNFSHLLFTALLPINTLTCRPLRHKTTSPPRFLYSTLTLWLSSLRFFLVAA